MSEAVGALPPLHDRTDEARTALEAHLRAAYRIEGAEEELLLERVADLTWRHRGVRLALHHLERLRRVSTEQTGAVNLLNPFPDRTYAKPPALETWDLQILTAANDKLSELVSMLDEGVIPPWEEATALLLPTTGSERLQGGTGKLPTLAMLLYGLPRLKKGSPERERARLHALDTVNELADLLDARIEQVRRDAQTVAVARMARAAAPTGDDLTALTAYERALAKDLTAATSALQGAVGERRLRALGQAWLRGR